MGAVKAAMIEQQEAATLETLQRSIDKLAVAVDQLATERDELLRACRGLLRIVEAIRCHTQLGNSQNERVERARAAIARAEGRS